MSNSAIRLLERAARLWPERVYVEEEGGSATYAALLARARTIGAALLGDRRPVVVYLPKSIDALAVFFGAMCAGRPYAPVDAHIPVARLEKIAQLEQKIDDMTDAMRQNQLQRMHAGADESAVIYSELLTDFERIGDHILNIGEAMTQISAPEYAYSPAEE